ncbi:hypothetical protein J2847_005898 [Azospirillum agricola]|uniref:hypothetical protein n=1 Tax=Azospirillum agricola TaxID=1720247 RepID=UPI001AEABEB6|nr:hypothetical protein [Azospirillum agricola]MBP2232569.1 hypothetical protein [Azospirillum agricola]
MSILLNTRAPVRFIPLIDQITKARETLADAEHVLAEATAKSAAAPKDIDLLEALDSAGDDVVAAQEALDKLERELAENPTQPVYLLRVPTYRTNDQLVTMSLELPQAPTDRRMFRAIQKAAEAGVIDLDDPDLLAVEAGLKTSGAGVPEDLTGAFQNLFDLASDHPTVRQTIVARHKANSQDRTLMLRFHLVGWEGVVVDDVPVPFASSGDLADEGVIDVIPPADILAIINKVREMNSVRKRTGNFSGLPSLSPSSPSDSPAAPTNPEPAAAEVQALDPAQA